MHRSSAGLLRDIRNMRHHNTTVMSKDVLTSGKQLKKIGSSEQINLNALEYKSDKIKSIDDKIQEHQNQILKNNTIISELNDNFIHLKQQLTKQHQQLQQQQHNSTSLREQLQRNNKIIRNKNLKIEEHTKKIQNLEKQNQIGKAAIIKNQDYIKVIGQLRKQVTNLQEKEKDNKNNIIDRDKEIYKIKQKCIGLDTLKNNIEYLKKDINQKQSIILQLQKQLNEVEKKNNEKKEENQKYQQKLKKIKQQLLIINNSYKNAQQRQKSCKLKLINSQNRIITLEQQLATQKKNIKSQGQIEFNLKHELQQLKKKQKQIMFQLKNQFNELNKKDTEIKQLNIQLENYKLQKQTNSNLKIQKNEYRTKFQKILNRSKVLQSLYSSIIPHIQCSYGHQLHNPVTVIPCGHNYCLQCKKGYTKQCMQCRGKLKIDAIYRNELMDDLINVVSIIKKIIDALQ